MPHIISWLFENKGYQFRNFPILEVNRLSYLLLTAIANKNRKGKHLIPLQLQSLIDSGELNIFHGIGKPLHWLALKIILLFYYRSHNYRSARVLKQPVSKGRSRPRASKHYKGQPLLENRLVIFYRLLL